MSVKFRKFYQFTISYGKIQIFIILVITAKTLSFFFIFDGPLITEILN